MILLLFVICVGHAASEYEPFVGLGRVAGRVKILNGVRTFEVFCMVGEYDWKLLHTSTRMFELVHAYTRMSLFILLFSTIPFLFLLFFFFLVLSSPLSLSFLFFSSFFLRGERGQYM
jgi:hypothetical protein